MKISIKTISIFAIIVGLTNCMDVVEVKVPNGEELLVVEGLITDQAGPYLVKLTKTAPYFDQKATPVVSGALAIITDSEGVSDTLVEDESGRYRTNHIRGKIGNKYKLYLKVEDQEYEAMSEIKRVPPIDSLLFSIAPANKALQLEAGFYPRYFGPELQGVGDHYRFKVYKNDTLINSRTDLAVSSDELVDGKYIGDLVLDSWRFKANEDIKVETLSITADTYQFFLEMWVQINNADQGLFANPVANVRTNLVNLDSTSEKRAVGYFYGAGVSFQAGKVKDEQTVIK